MITWLDKIWFLKNMKNIFNRKIINETFNLAVLVKSIFGIFEVLTGIVLAISGRLIVNNLIIAITQQEILEDPNDSLANYLIKISDGYSNGGNVFAIAYLIFHGAINIFLAVALGKNKTWAYHSALTVFGLFIIYQVYRYFHTYSILLLILTILDILIILVIMLKYRNKDKSKK